MTTKKIKILIIFPMDPLGNKVGGIETCIKNILKYLPENFIMELIGISSDFDKRPVGRWQVLKIGQKEFNFLPVLYIKDENKKSRVPLVVRFIFSLLKYRHKIKFKDKILEFHRIEPFILFRNKRNKMVLFIHGDMNDLYNPMNEVKWSKIPILYFWLEKFLIRRFDIINIVSESGASSYKDRYPTLSEKIYFTPTWVDQEVFYPYSPEDKSIEKNKFLSSLNYSIDSILVLFAGRLEKAKNPGLLLKVFKYLNKKIPRSRLLIIGAGSLEKDILKIVDKYKLQGLTYIGGAVDQEALSNIMRICDIFLLTSAFEGMSRSVLEALACGLPVITTKAGEVGKIVHNYYSGFISDNGDPKKIGDLVIKVLENPERFKKENCLVSIKDYTAEKILNKIYSDYERL